MTRSRLSVVCLELALLAFASCEWIADIPERKQQLTVDPCERYCQRSMQLCTGQYAIFHNPTDCANICATYGDDELQCREDALEKVAQSMSNEAPTYCANASLSGGAGDGQCGGSACENYCKAMGQVCGEDYPEPGVTYSSADCIRQCSVIPERAGRTASESTFNLSLDHEGDTIQCRLVHLTLASTNAILEKDHCPHAYINPQPMVTTDPTKKAPPFCGTGKDETAPHCEDYCSVVNAACVDTNDEKTKVYESYSECTMACGALDPGNLGMYEGTNSVACRKVHSYNAVLGSPTTHCPHAGPGGAGTCGDDCDSLCTLIEHGCSDQYKSKFMGNEKTCRDQCKASDDYKKRGNYSVAAAKRGDAFACRLYHSVQAQSQPDDNKDACEVAAGIRGCPFSN